MFQVDGFSISKDTIKLPLFPRNRFGDNKDVGAEIGQLLANNEDSTP
jgi:hypothetical protein